MQRGLQHLGNVNFAEIGFQKLRVDENLLVGRDLDADVAEPRSVELQRNFHLHVAAGRVERDLAREQSVPIQGRSGTRRSRAAKAGPKPPQLAPAL